MNAQEKKEVIGLIIEKIEQTKVEIAELKELTKPIAPENAIGRISRMDAINNKSVNDAALRKAEERFKQLTEALKRSEEKDFGKCARCSNEIPIRRIMLVPQSRFCVTCASR